MSLNLCFTPKDSEGIISFPFDLPTNISIKVLTAKTTEERMAILKNYLIKINWHSIDKTIKLLESLFANQALTIGIT